VELVKGGNLRKKCARVAWFVAVAQHVAFLHIVKHKKTGNFHPGSFI
jgi:hypothetical protein